MRFITFTEHDAQLIHQASLKILAETGVVFPSEPTQEVFRRHGFRLDGDKVFITERQLDEALSTIMPSITLRARNPENNLVMGGDKWVMAPTAGAPNVMDRDGTLRPGIIADYATFCKLVQTSKIKMVMSNRVCFPHDVPAEKVHLEALFLDLTLTDRVVMTSTASVQQTADGLKMLDMVFGGREKVKTEPCSLNVINVCTPLKYAPDQSEILMLLAENNQPVAVTNMMMLGATAPVTIAGALSLGNAEIMAGVILSQLVRPGAPVIYGSTSCPMDMKSMVATLGAPEAAWLSKGAVKMAEFYGLPCRTGGTLTDSFRPDAQAYVDGGFMLQNAMFSGAHFILHAFGMIGSYLAASLDKFVIDEEMASLIMASMIRPEISEETLQFDVINELGASGGYLTQPSTMKNFRKLYRSAFLNRGVYDQWEQAGRRDTSELAGQEVSRRISTWQKPAIEPELEAELRGFIDSHA